MSFETPEYTANADALGTLRILESIKNLNKTVKFYQASTSEMFGSTPPPQSENQYLDQLVHMAHQKSFLIGSQKIIEMHMDYLLVMEFCLIMKAQIEVKLL